MSDVTGDHAKIGDAGGPSGVADLVDALVALRREIEAVALPLETVTAATARRERERGLDQLDDYLLPRLRADSAPLLVVVGGSTGAGKSTLVNSILGQHVTTPGALRPTTRSPVLVHHPLDAEWFTSDRIFPHLAREVSSSPGPTPPGAPGDHPRDGDPRSLRLVPTDVLPQGMALLDAPDVDSVVAGNRELAAQLLAAADLWLFVTTAARYADAVPWELLSAGAARRAQVALVIDRVDPGAEVVGDHLRQMLADQGLPSAPVFLLRESVLVDGMLPVAEVAPVSRWLTAMGSDDGARGAVIAATRDGVVDDLVARAMTLADASDAQALADAALRRAVAEAYAAGARDMRQATSDGSMLRGEVLSRWQDFVGTGDFMRGVEEKIGVLRDRVSGYLRGRPAAAPKVNLAIGHSLEAIVFDAADRASERAYLMWRADPAGAVLLDGLVLSRASADLRGELAGQVRAWQGDVLALVSDRGAGKRGRARTLAIGVNGIGAALMVVVFASTGGLTGAEVGIAGGSVVLAQRLLEAVFGDEAVRSLAHTAQDLLDARVEAILEGQAARFTAILDGLVPGGLAPGGPPPGLDAGPGLRAAAHEVQSAAAHERAARAAQVRTHPTHVSLTPDDVSTDRSHTDTDRMRLGQLRGADLPIAVDPYAHPAPPPGGPRVLSRLWWRKKARPGSAPVSREGDS
ncbi:Dynamin family protein [Sanguibacter gelidistatuariae]|uniref:Dynamin family protein n=1 Tax=Sanguibacter gelidistatuariae TaxID=1814289 RepID=A0A1G6N6C8_9MICO|nr:dynamin family protein [Sanguibacter gelidistatuariae]SDC63418.1 Dynamin family protein [Sanguibacter gelidistatuariae]